jgi:ABC-type multidrug transport system ATPase subunit
VIEFRGVGKTYRSGLRRSVRAVDDFTLQVAEGEILGIAGPNGAGKSTLIAMLLGYTIPTDGSVTIAGESPRVYIEANGVGYLSELVNIPPRWTAESAIRRYAILAGIEEADLDSTVDASIARVGLAEHRKKRVKALSKGTVQRLGLAQALLRDCRVLILDEPTHGLDPVWTQRFRNIVAELRSPDRIILIASHNLDELQRVADRVAIMDHGKLQRLVSTGFESTLASQSDFRITVVEGADLVREIAPGAVPVGKGEFELRPKDVADLNAMLAQLIAGGVMLGSVVPTRSILEQQFRDVVGDDR